MSAAESDSNPFLGWKSKDPEALDLALDEFNKKFPSNQHCVEEIIRRLNANWCRHCASRSVERGFGNRKLRCLSCNKYSWPLAGTFFERMKLSRLHLGAIMLQEQGFAFSANALAQWFASAFSTALELLRKLRIIAIKSMFATTDEETNAFEVILLRRSLETPAGKHPSTDIEYSEFETAEHEQSASGTEASAIENITDDQGLLLADEKAHAEIAFVGSASRPKLEEELTNLLSSKPVTFDELVSMTGETASAIGVALTMLEFAGVATRIPGDRYLRHNPHPQPKRSNSQPNSSIVGTIVSFIYHYYGGISRRYLQLYIGSFWMHATYFQFGEFRLFETIEKFGTVSLSFVKEIRSERVVLVP